MSIRYPLLQSRILAVMGFRFASLIMLRVFIERTIRSMSDDDSRCPLSIVTSRLRKLGILTNNERGKIHWAMSYCSQAAHGIQIDHYRKRTKKAYRVACMVAAKGGDQ